MIFFFLNLLQAFFTRFCQKWECEMWHKCLKLCKCWEKSLKETRKCTVMYRARENTLVYQRIMHETERLSTKNEQSVASEILGTIVQPRALTCKIPARQKRLPG